jgi:hypothetical protein
MPRHVLASASLALLLLATAAHGQETSSPDKAQLDRIEGKLDQLLQRLGPGPLPFPAPGQAAAAAPAVDSAAYAPGAIAVIHPAPATTRVLAEVPPDSVGGFVYTGGPMTLHDLSERGVRYAGLAGLELQGWLKVTAPGRVQLGADYRGSFGQAVLFGTDCLLEAWLEGRQVGQESTRLVPGPDRTGSASLVLGAEVQPGLYQLRLWTACLPLAGPSLARITLDLLLKTPDDLSLRTFMPDQVLHRIE